MVRIEGKRTSRTIYEFDSLAEINTYHTQLAKYRVSKKSKLATMVKRLDMKQVLVNMKLNMN